jgi:hypothetical protein
MPPIKIGESRNILDYFPRLLVVIAGYLSDGQPVGSHHQASKRTRTVAVGHQVFVGDTAAATLAPGGTSRPTN